MTIEGADLLSRLNLEQTAPVSGATIGGEHSAPAGGEDKPRRRPPPEASAVPAEKDGEKDKLPEQQKEKDEKEEDDKDKDDKDKDDKDKDNDGEDGERPEHRIDSLA